jgi:hypothetical protein
VPINRKEYAPKMPEIIVIPVGFISRWESLSDGGLHTEGKGEDPEIPEDDQQMWSGAPSLLDLSFADDLGGENRCGTNI